MVQTVSVIGANFRLRARAPPQAAEHEQDTCLDQNKGLQKPAAYLDHDTSFWTKCQNFLTSAIVAFAWMFPVKVLIWLTAMTIATKL
jgi:hypothetical protein